MDYGDIRLGDTIDVKFTTRRFTTGAPFALAGGVISAYVGNGTTEITAGITLTVDFDSRTGLNNVRVVASSGNGFATATNVQLVITTGTVDSVSVVGEVVATFSIENRSALMPTSAGRTLGVEASGKVNVLLADTVTNYTGNTPQTGDSFARIGVAGAGLTNIDLPNQTMDITGNITGNVSGSVGSVTGAVGSVTAGVTLAASAVQAIWDALTSALTSVGSVGKLLVDNVNATIGSRSSHSAADVWAAGTRTLTAFDASFKTGYALSAAGVQAMWDALTSALTTVGSIGKLLVDNIDAAMSSRLPTAGYTTPPTVGAIADQVWDEAIAGHAGAGSTGEALAAAGSAGDPWTTALPGAYGAGTAGKIVGDNLNATVGSRSSHSAADVWAVGTRTLTSFGTLVADVATAVWSAGARTLTSFGSLVSDIWAAAVDSPGVTTLLTRLGAFTGSGVNTVLGFLKALLNKAASTPSDVGGTFDAATDSTEAIRDRGDAAWADSGTPPSAAAIATQVRTELATELARVDVATSTRLATAGYTTPPTAIQNADAYLDRADAVEAGITPRGAMRLGVAADAGKVSGAATTTVRLRNVADTKDRVTATVDADGNRTATAVDTT